MAVMRQYAFSLLWYRRARSTANRSRSPDRTSSLGIEQCREKRWCQPISFNICAGTPIGDVRVRPDCGRKTVTRSADDGLEQEYSLSNSAFS